MNPQAEDGQLSSYAPVSENPQDGMSRRLKALACTAPLHDLDHRKNHLEWVEAGDYQMSEIALHLIDVITISMDFDYGATREQVITRARPVIAAQTPKRLSAEHDRVAEWILDSLINVGSQERGFSATYGARALDGAYTKKRWSFKLIMEFVAANGEICLRATDEAINVLLGALDTNVESAQLAAETKLDSLISRGRLSDAQNAALEARLRTIQYADMIRRKMTATSRDIRSVDWLDEMPTLLSNALDHIEGRTRAELKIKTSIEQIRNDAEDPYRKRKAAELVSIVDECIQRHQRLQGRLNKARSEFRSEQDRQEFSGVIGSDAIDIHGSLLRPVLGESILVADQVLSAYFHDGVGLVKPRLPRLTQLMHSLLSPPAESNELGELIEVPELVQLETPEVFSNEQWQYAEELLTVDAVPRRLSGLLAQARIRDPQVAHLILLLALYAVSPEVKMSSRPVLLAVDDGVELDDPEFGGADLLLGLARWLPPSKIVPSNPQSEVLV